MSSRARSDFLIGLSALRDAADESSVKSATATGAFIRKGLTVAAFNLLEGFVSDRWVELANYINSGHTQFLDLPEKLQRRAIRQTISIAHNELRRKDFSIQDLRAYAYGIGESVGSVSANLKLSPFTWKWEGSNMSADDFATALKFVHVPRPYDVLRDLSGRLGFPVTAADGTRMDLKEDLNRLAQERHQSAHVASHPITSIWLRAVPDRVLRFGVCFDALASIGAIKIHEGDSDFLGDEGWLSNSRVSIKFVQERSYDFALMKEHGARAIKVGRDGDSLFRVACSLQGPEVVVRRDRARSVTDWSITPVG